jgi:hypothetical protein
MNIYGQIEGQSAFLLCQSSSNGLYASPSSPVYFPTGGTKKTYMIWAVHPNSPNTISVLATYYFDPDNYQGGGDAFDWNGTGNVGFLIVPDVINPSIVITSGKAWLGVSDFGVALEIYAQAPGEGPFLLAQTPDFSPGTPTLGNGIYASSSTNRQIPVNSATSHLHPLD